nr:RRXRR domain-containing protein [Desulfobacter latus]
MTRQTLPWKQEDFKIECICSGYKQKAAEMELVRFDMQKIQNPEMSGVAYQQGELMGYEVREYLLEKWDRTCAYCSKLN